MTIKELLESAGITLTQEQETKLNAEFPKAFKPAEVYNADIKKHKDAAEDAQKLLKEANETIEGFKAMDIEGIKKSADDWKLKAEQAEKEAAAKISDMEFSGRLDNAIIASKGKSAKAIRALLDMEGLKASKNQETDIKAALEALQKDNGYLFGDATPGNPPPPAGGKPAGTETNEMAKWRAEAGLPPLPAQKE